ncbi:hypothetical protein DMC25_23220 [Caulobacter sp. D4A]|uniref:aminotransferase class I/II-fold pyridoxal phosphate-dependent enzyme n=1 Tax=unclassified Caulobacter TaxID=2648921 RepID=UPI000D7342BC|nr:MULTISPECIES: aminotransferase class I/II-fold pyridoxal phosphate-dependent enzyme [unclassified Caulobacter]PXA77590.1 hypothetical protein DMC25_23220 [Caulobacter sp. D4A]PXA96142.1 hypothetical protein DMC18_02110 [Caulobacter sp. D5]
MTSSALTYAERSIATGSRFDLGAGYPIGLAPSWAEMQHVRRLHPHPPERGARSALDLEDEGVGVIATFSGSVALQRGFLAARAHIERSGRRSVVVTTEPCIDIIPAIAREVVSAGPVRVACGLLQSFSDDDCDRFCAKIVENAGDAQGVIAAITSPENPTGAVWSPAHLRRFSQTCLDTGSVLIVDHCFLLAGVHGPDIVTPVWRLVNEQAPVIAIWDTGKTVHLGGSKLGFLISRNPELRAHLENAVSVIQYDLPLHLGGWIGGVLGDPRFREIVDDLRKATRTNQKLLQEATARLGLPQLGAHAGAFELVKTDRPVVIGATVPLTCFEESSGWGRGWRRIALARAPIAFEEAITHLLE